MKKAEIKSLRQKLGLTQSEFAARLGVARQAVGKWESGKASPGADSIVALRGLQNPVLPKIKGKPGPAPSGMDERSVHAQRVAKIRAAKREIEIPECENPKRRESCRLNLPLFTETYFSKPPDLDKLPGEEGLCYLGLSDMHRRVLKDYQERILFGGLEALAAPRGFGKDTMAIVAAIWATIYGHTRFFVFACFEQSEAEKRIETIKQQIEINTWLRADFPEVCVPAKALERAAQRGKQQTHAGEYTRIEWGKTIVLPSIPGSLASGCVIAPASLSGSVRGMNKNGSRPSFVAISDPQTDEVAKSETQRADVMRKIHKDFGGLGAVDKPLACLALVTIIRKGDVADQLTDRKTNPQWNGLRYKAIEEMPIHMDLWDKYAEMLDDGSREGDSTGRQANQYYLDNRAEMDAGSRVAWEEAFIKSPAPDGSPLEVSALQHLMNLRWRWGEDAFLTEYQNEPPEEESLSGLTADLVSSRLSMYPEFVAPTGQTFRLVQFIDVGAREIHYAVLALAENGNCTFVDYGQLIVYAPEGDLRDPGGASRGALERRVLDALRQRRDEIAATAPYRDEDGKPIQISLTCVDSGWLNRIVYQFTRESGPKWRSTKGHQSKPGNHKYSVNKTHKVVGDHWHAEPERIAGALYHIDSDYWKLYTHERFLQTPGTVGAVSLWGNSDKLHRRFGKHIVAEEWDPASCKWKLKYKYNHFLDCAAGCFAAANMAGVRPFEHKRPEPRRHVDSEKAAFRMPDGRPYLISQR